MSTERETVKRYDLVGHDEYCTMQPYEEGDYVLFADYDAQREADRRRMEELELELAEAKVRQQVTSDAYSENILRLTMEQQCHERSVDEVAALQQRCEALERERDAMKKRNYQLQELESQTVHEFLGLSALLEKEESASWSLLRTWIEGMQADLKTAAGAQRLAAQETVTMKQVLNDVLDMLQEALQGTRQDPSWIRPIQLSHEERQALYQSCQTRIEQALAPQQAQQTATGLREALEVTTKWMQWWIENEGCGCEPEGHKCGLPARRRELEEAQQALARRAQKGGRQ